MTLVNTLVGASVVIITMVTLISYKLMLAILIPLPFLAFLISKLGNSIRQRFLEAQESFGTMNDQALESITGIRVIRSYVQRWIEWMEQYRETEGTVHLPRFQLEYELELNNALSALGMEAAFSESKADFGNMIDTPPNLFISNVLHKTFVKVDEEGTEAAAVTKVETQVGSAPANMFEMKLNRPFFFAIIDQWTGTVLFMGLIEDPLQ